MSGPRIKLLALILLPLVILSVIGTTLTIGYTSKELEARALASGNAIADQLAITITDPLSRRDTLHLNVMLNNLLARNNFAFASVYGADGRLIAQAGKSEVSQITLSRDVTFQDAAAGSLRIGLTQEQSGFDGIAVISAIVLAHLLVFVSLFALLWFYGDLVLFWLSAPEGRPRPSAAPSSSEPDPVQNASSGHITILVAKIRPVRQLEAHRRKLRAALALYPCEVEETDGDDIVITFASPDQIFDAVLTGVLLSAICRKLYGNIKVRLGMHTIASTEPALREQARKHATYLASIADTKLLASKQVIEQVTNPGKMDFREFRSSLTPDGEVYYLESINEPSREVVNRQALQFA